jgi:hypothetical protein
MSKQTRLRLIFPGLGLPGTAVIYVSGWFRFPEKLPKWVSILANVLQLVSPLVCPPSLLSAVQLGLDPYSVWGGHTLDWAF